MRRAALAGAMCVVVAASAVCGGCGASRDDGVVELVFWHAWTGHEGDFLDSLIDEFNATHPGIHVKSMSFVIGDKLMAAIAGGIPPDVATVWDWMLPALGEAGCLMPLDDLLAESGVGKDDYLPGIWDYGMFGPVKYGVPTAINVTMLFYNTALLRQAGWDPEQPPRTLDELTRLASELSEYDDAGRLTRIGYMPSNAHIWFWNFGGDLYDEATGELVIDSPENVEALAWMTSFYRRHGIERYRRFTSTFGEYASPNSPFYKEQFAVTEDGQWQILFTRRFAPSLEYTVAPFPEVRPGEASQTVVGGSFWAIPVGCPHPEEAWTLLRWLIDPPQSARFAAALYNIPPMHAALDDPAYQPLMETRVRDFVALLEQGRARSLPALPLGKLLMTELNAALEEVFAGELTPQEGLSKVQARLQKALDKALRYADLYEDAP